MSFWLSSNKFVIYTRQISLLFKMIISFSVILFFTTSWFYFIYLPAKNKIIQQQTKLVELNNTAEEFKKLAKSFDIEQDKNKKLHALFKSLKKSKIKSKNVSNYLLSLFTKHNLSCSDIRPLFSKSKQNYDKDYFNLTIKGKFCNFLNFLEDSSRQNLILNFSYLNIVRWKDEKIKADIIFRNINFHKI